MSIIFLLLHYCFGAAAFSGFCSFILTAVISKAIDYTSEKKAQSAWKH